MPKISLYNLFVCCPFLMLFFSTSMVSGQDYQPTALEGANWIIVDTETPHFPNSTFVRYIEGDTIIEGIVYKKLYQRVVDYLGELAWPPLEPPYNLLPGKELIALLRDDVRERRVYGRMTDFYNDTPGLSIDTLVHDYSLEVGDTLKGWYFAGEFDGPLVVVETGTAFYAGAMRRYQQANDLRFYEGIGSFEYGPTSGGSSLVLNCCHRYLIDYCAGDFPSCNIIVDDTTSPQNYQPAAIEGAKWVHTNTRASNESNYNYVVEIEGDTVIDAVAYKKVYRRNMYFDWFEQLNYRPRPPYDVAHQRSIIGVVRDDVQARSLYGRYLLAGGDFSEDVLLHDFSLGVSDTLRGAFFAENPFEALVVYETGEESVFGELRNFQNAGEVYHEGIVSSSYGIWSGGSAFITNDGITVVENYCVGEFSDCDIKVIDPAALPYQPLAVENANWVIWDRSPVGPLRGHRILSIRGDTIIGGVAYKKIYRRAYVPEDPSNIWNASAPYPVSNQSVVLLAAVRDDSIAQRVYARYLEPSLAQDYPGEQLVHDYLANEGELITADAWCGEEDVERVQWITIYDKVRKYQHTGYDDVFVSGIGKVRGRNGGVFTIERGCAGGNAYGQILTYCIGDDAACGFEWPTAVHDFSKHHQLTLSPNPFVNQLTIKASNPFAEAVRVSLLNPMGQVLQTANFWDELNWSLEKNPPGIYLLVFDYGGDRVVRKVVKR